MYPVEPSGRLPDLPGNELADVHRTFFAGDADQRNRCLFTFHCSGGFLLSLSIASM